MLDVNPINIDWQKPKIRSHLDESLNNQLTEENIGNLNNNHLLKIPKGPLVPFAQKKQTKNIIINVIIILFFGYSKNEVKTGIVTRKLEINKSLFISLEKLKRSVGHQFERNLNILMTSALRLIIFTTSSLKTDGGVKGFKLDFIKTINQYDENNRKKRIIIPIKSKVFLK